MDNRQRFYESLHFGTPDRLPYFEEGIREDTLQAWKEQGHSIGEGTQELIEADVKEEIKIDLVPIPGFQSPPRTFEELESLEKYLDGIKLTRILPDWPAHIQRFKKRETEQILREVEVDALVFNEPIGSNTGALISPLPVGLRGGTNGDALS